MKISVEKTTMVNNEFSIKKYDWAGDFHGGLACVEKDDYYGLIDKEGNEITDICFEGIKISEGVIIFNNEYIVPIENLKLIYVCFLNIKNNTRSLEFDSKEKRDKFYSEIITKIVDKKIELHNLKIEMEEKVYSDFDLEIKKEYTKIKRK